MLESVSYMRTSELLIHRLHKHFPYGFHLHHSYDFLVENLAMPNNPQIHGTRAYVCISFIGPYLLYTLSPLLIPWLGFFES